MAGQSCTYRLTIKESFASGLFFTIQEMKSVSNSSQKKHVMYLVTKVFSIMFIALYMSFVSRYNSLMFSKTAGGN
jgi:hypothetical protein